MNVETLIANRIRALRKTRGYTLGQVADRSGVSRSMISLIERDETSPTAAVLHKLADALGVTLASLFSDDPRGEPEPLARLSEQQVWKDPASGYVRRHVSPSGYASPIELVEVTFPPGERVAFESMARNVMTHQQVWILEGEMEITVGAKSWHLLTGDCLAMELGQHIVFRNPTHNKTRYVVVLAALQSNQRILR